MYVCVHVYVCIYVWMDGWIGVRLRVIRMSAHLRLGKKSSVSEYW